MHGIALAEDLGRGYVSAGAADEVVVFRPSRRWPGSPRSTRTGANPDAILYDKATHRILTFQTVGVATSPAIDARNNTVIGSLALNAKPEFAVDDEAGHVFVNLEDRASVARIDLKDFKVHGVWPLKGCEEPSGIALDRAHGRLFSVCSNKVMAVTDVTSGRQVALLKIGDNVDGCCIR